jgi:5-methylcytosine-specific restriction endonuclease McrA
MLNAAPGGGPVGEGAVVQLRKPECATVVYHSFARPAPCRDPSGWPPGASNNISGSIPSRPPARGYDRDWERARAEHLEREPYCHRCAVRGIERRAQTVDHIEPIREAPERRLDPTNFQSLYWPCHNSKTHKSGGQGGYKKFRATRRDGFASKFFAIAKLGFGHTEVERTPAPRRPSIHISFLICRCPRVLIRCHLAIYSRCRNVQI